MLKKTVHKAALVTAATAAGLLALAPLAMADEQSNTVDESTTNVSGGGLININLLNGGLLNEGLLNDSNICPNANAGLLGGVLGLLGLGGTTAQGTTCVTYNDNTAQLNQED